MVEVLWVLGDVIAGTVLEQQPFIHRKFPYAFLIIRPELGQIIGDWVLFDLNTVQVTALGVVYADDVELGLVSVDRDHPVVIEVPGADVAVH